MFLSLPGVRPLYFRIECDWSGYHGGYLLFAVTKGATHLVDIGSKTIKEQTSSLLGELKTIIWSCQSTKAYRGSTRLQILSDNLSVVEQFQSGFPTCKDKRVLRLWGWLSANENYAIDFIPGKQNCGADLLSHPRQTNEASAISINQLTAQQYRSIEKAHQGHWGWRRTYENLKQQEHQLWTGARRDTQRFVKACTRCQRYGPMLKVPTWKAIEPQSLNSDVFVNYLGPLQWSPDDEPMYVCVIVDALSRFPY